MEHGACRFVCLNKHDQQQRTSIICRLRVRRQMLSWFHLRSDLFRHQRPPIDSSSAHNVLGKTNRCSKHDRCVRTWVCLNRFQGRRSLSIKWTVSFLCLIHIYIQDTVSVFCCCARIVAIRKGFAHFIPLKLKALYVLAITSRHSGVASILRIFQSPKLCRQ